MLSIVAVAALAYAATNFDNLLLVVAVVSRPGQPFSSVLAATLMSAVALVALCIGAAFATDFVPQRWLGALGLLPIFLGLRELLRLARRKRDAGDGADPDVPPLESPAVAMLLLANSADTLGVLVPLFAETRDELLPAIAITVLAVAALGCALARWIASHPRLGPRIQRLGPLLVPFVLIGVGLYVLADTRSDTDTTQSISPPSLAKFAGEKSLP